MKEIWKDIEGFNGYYQISNYGRVKNAKRNTIRKAYDNNAGKGYYYVDLYKKNIRVKRDSIHRLVAKAFIPNPKNKPMINHKDGNTKNNHVSNLEWVTALENVTHASNILGVMVGYKKHIEKQKRKVKQMKNGKEIKIYESIAEASRQTGISTSQIIFTCQGKYKQTHGYQWQYVYVKE